MDLRDDQLITAKQLRELMPMSAMSEWRRRKLPGFPQPVKISNRCYYRAAEVRSYIDHRAGEAAQ